LGLSHPPQDTKEEADWAELTKDADQKICDRFPVFKESPGYVAKPHLTPYRLYNAIAPLSDSTVAFVGCVSVITMFLGAELQALWATAYLDGNIEALPSPEEQKKQVALDNQWSRRRYPFESETSGIVFNFEIVSYFDRLLRELGLSSHLQKSWWEFWTGYNSVDVYRGLKDEYLAKLKEN
jgi:dimethylaniline monooxygenase (N-oxide forming)